MAQPTSGFSSPSNCSTSTATGPTPWSSATTRASRRSTTSSCGPITRPSSAPPTTRLNSSFATTASTALSCRGFDRSLWPPVIAGSSPGTALVRPRVRRETGGRAGTAGAGVTTTRRRPTAGHRASTGVAARMGPIMGMGIFIIRGQVIIGV